MNLSQCVWTADWTINDVELPHDLPAPVCSPHELCRAAAKAIKKHAKHKLGSDQVLLHWPLADGGLFVYGGDNIRLVVKASYRMNAAEVETGVISSSSRDKKKAEAGRERREGELRRLGAARNTLRFFTRERCVHVPQQASGMTATLRGGRYVDCHQTGAYLLELESAESAESGGAGKLGTALSLRSLRSSREPRSSGAEERALFRISSLSLAFDLAELRQELARVEQPSPSLAPSDGAAPSTMMLEMARTHPRPRPRPRPRPSRSPRPSPSPLPHQVRNLDTGEAIHVSEIDERIAAGQQPQSLRPLARVPPPAGFLASLFKVRVRVSVRVGVRVRVRVRVSLTLTLTP